MVVVGAGPAGLAISRCLTGRSIDHVVLERHGIAHAWGAERWDSLRLLTPNWLTRLPGGGFDGDDPEGYMTAAELLDHLLAYASSFDAPVHEHCDVSAVRIDDEGFTLATSSGPWRCRTLLVATGAASVPRIPDLATDLPSDIEQLTPSTYRNPAWVDDGRVLIVGASASGVQIADELQRAGRDVVLSVGEHVRLPRTYRGMDIHWWLHALGEFDQRREEIDDPLRVRRVLSPQLLGSPERRNVDLNALTGAGVELVGRVVAIRNRTTLCSGTLAHVCRAADLKQQRLLDRIDALATTHGLGARLAAAHRPEPTRVVLPRTELSLAGVRTVVWATGFRPDHRWLGAPLVDRHGTIRHEGGVAAIPGLYVIGLPFLRRRSSGFLGGFGADAAELVDHLAADLDRRSMAA